MFPPLRLPLIGLVASLFGTLALGQGVETQTANLTAGQQRGALSGAPTAGQTVLKARVRQVLLDVVVTRQGQPVHGLNQDDFVILENGEQQRIVSFTESTGTVDSRPEPASQPDLPPNAFTNTASAADQLPINVLLYDLLNTQLTDQPFAHQEVRKFLRNKPADSRFAIFALGNKLRLIQGLTEDRERLIAAMNRDAQTRPSLFPVPSTDTIAPSQMVLQSGLPMPPGSGPILERLATMEATETRYLQERRIAITIDALREISRFLSGVPGRKNLIWLASSFPLGLAPLTDPLNTFPAAAPYSHEFKEAADELILSQIAIYPVDVGGLTTDPIYDAANANQYRTAADFQAAHQDFILGLFGKQLMMDEIAEESGGHAFYNTNGVADAVATALREGSNHYTLSYSPSNTKFDGGLRRIHVRLHAKGCRLSYRRSYYALDPPDTGPVDQLERSMERGAPQRHDLVFQVQATPQGQPLPPTGRQRRVLGQFEPYKSHQVKSSVQLQRYLLSFAIPKIESGGAAEPESAGMLEVGCDLYDRENRLAWRQRNVIQGAVLKDHSEAEGRSFRFTISLDVPSGAGWLRIGVQQLAAARIGTIEIPLSTITGQ